ncbi:hypothetical protein TruAng_007760 [Truncatella angustata]|nr:hypothetical protein TruAng_007760 [Truncatella angustata]
MIRIALDVACLIEFTLSLVAGPSHVAKQLTLVESQRPLVAASVTEHLQAILGPLSSTIDDSSVDGSVYEDGLKSLARRCLVEASLLLDLLPTITNPDPAASWQVFQLGWAELSQTEVVAACKARLLECATDLCNLLIEVFNNESFSLNKNLETLHKESERIYSSRATEILKTKKGIISALKSFPQNQAKAKSSRKAPKPLAPAPLSSDSTEDVERPVRTYNKRTKARRSILRTTGSSSAKPTEERLINVIETVKNGLTSLCHLLQVVPYENCLLRYLSFDSVDSREDSIQNAGSGTFGWILNDSPVSEPNLDIARKSYIKWLESGSGVFHISGKAGAGKSTLMKFLRHHYRTKESLERWAGQEKLIISSFYFWNSGGSMQMSLEGLYRSILLETCRQCPELISSLFPQQWTECSSNDIEDSTDDPFWNTETIRDAFTQLMTQDIAHNYSMCFFIDGLDEYTVEEVDYWSLARNINSWSKKPSIKFCVSARPYTEFLETFDPDLRFHLHELTMTDISTFAEESFEKTEGLDFESSVMNSLVGGIAMKSEGVFVWVRIAVRSLISLFNHGMSTHDLIRTLESYPAEIDDLYECILSPLTDEEKDRSNTMMVFAAQNPYAQALNALCMSWIDDLTGDEQFPRINHPYTSVQVSRRHETIRADIEWLTKGLLEMHTDRRERKDGDQFYRQRIQFSHRTARDFLRSPARLEALKRSFDFTKLNDMFAGLRLAEIVLAGKYRVNQGADPRRRRLYFNYVRSLFHLRTDDGLRYQLPLKYMCTLSEDLQSTHAEKFLSPYAISSYHAISGSGAIDEDPEKAASFLHFAVAHGQFLYAVHVLQNTKRQTSEHNELHMLLSAAFGHKRLGTDDFAALVSLAPSPLDRIGIRPSLGADPFANANNTKLVSHITGTLERAQGNEPTAIVEEAPQYICILENTKSRTGKLSSTDIIFTTLSELARRYQHDVAEDLLLRLERITPRVSGIIQPDGSAMSTKLPPWCNSDMAVTGTSISGTLVRGDELDDCYCTSVLSQTEKMVAADGLFFRLY